jgi:hypothetical protein
MRFYLTSTALALVLAASASAAQAETLITQPGQTVQTTETVRTVRPVASRAVRREVVTTRTFTRTYVPARAVIARTVPATPQPLYDEVAPAPIASDPDYSYSRPADYSYSRPADYSYSRPLYDEVTTSPVMAAPPVGAMPVVEDGYTTTPIYRYVYEPNRILVIDPSTNIAVQSIPR